MLSAWMMGAMASKKASALSSVRSRMASASAGEVSGPVAMMTLDQSAGGRPAISATHARPFLRAMTALSLFR